MKSIKKLANWYFSRSALPYWGILLLDFLFVVFSGLLAYTVHHGSAQTINVLGSLCLTLCTFLVCFITGFRVFHTYSGVMRYSSFSDLLRVGSAVILGAVLCCAVLWAFNASDWVMAYGYADIILMGLFVVAFMWTVRVWVKTVFEQTSKRVDASRTYILGVRNGGVALAKSIRSSADSPYILEGFVSDKGDMENRMLMGVKVHPFDNALPETMRHYWISTLTPPLDDGLSAREGGAR